ncbi:Flp family type IVb pilin [Candidatus Clostridium radicumherbarum]|uniref:Flp family type IVb pilin n=1 Tax=Candidatus Clostridium radicumherbarum TaxID=3381662 RepID=A0ABW8TQF0_9CLOT
MLKLVNRLLSEEEGQGMTEYALVLGIISIAIIVAISSLNGNVETLWTHRSEISNALVKNTSPPSQ